MIGYFKIIPIYDESRLIITLDTIDAMYVLGEIKPMKTQCATCETPATDLNPLYRMKKGKRTKLFCGMCASEAEQNGWKHAKA